MRIDAHHSFSDRYPLEHLGTILHRNRFVGSVLVTAEIPPELPEFVRAVVVKAERIDPHMLDEYQREPRFRGVCCSLAPESLEGIGELERRGLTLDVAGGVELLDEVVERWPRLRVVVVDAGLLTSLPPGVCAKLTRPVANALQTFGAERLMFGSDWPARLPDVTWKGSLAAFTQSIGAQPISVREQLLGGTAAGFYAI